MNEDTPFGVPPDTKNAAFWKFQNKELRPCNLWSEAITEFFNGMGTSKSWSSNKIIMSYPDEERRRQLTKPTGIHKNLFDELRLNKDLYKRYKEGT